MFPKLVDLGGPWVLSSYGALVAAGFLVGIWIVVRMARLETHPPLTAEAVVDACVWSLLVGLVGSKLLMIAVDWRLYVKDPRQILHTIRYAGVFYGGILLSAVFLWIYCSRRKIPILQMLDVMSPGAALGHALGRVGCFSIGCCWGRECHLPWAVTFRSEYAATITGVPLGVPIHPVQLYEVATNLAIFAVLFFWIARRAGRRRGEVFCLYFLLYAIVRFGLEFLRDDPRGQWLGGALSTSQGIAIAVALAGGSGWWFLHRRGDAVFRRVSRR